MEKCETKKCHIMLAYDFVQKIYLPPAQSILDLFFIHWKVWHIAVIIILFWSNVRFYFHVFSFTFQNKIPVENSFSLPISYEILVPVLNEFT